MATTVDLRHAERAAIRHCYKSLDPVEVRQNVLRSLREHMSIDAAFFATADPDSLLFTSAHAEDPLGDSTPLFLDNEFRGDDVNQFAALATSTRNVSTLDHATKNDRQQSRRYTEIMRPLGLGDELRAALIANDECWGYLCLHREDGQNGFSSREIALLRRLGPHLAHALRQAFLSHVPTDHDRQRPGVLLIDEHFDVVATTPEAEELLALLPNAPNGLPVAMNATAAALVGSQRLPSARVRALDGSLLNVHASWLGPHISVVVERATPHATAAILLAAYGLTGREREIARHVIRGASTKAISATLHISTNTVQDHLKSVFDKTGVRSRRDLIGLLLGT